MLVRTSVAESLAALAELNLGPVAVQLGDAGDLAAVQRELTDPSELGQAAWMKASFRALACVLRASGGLNAVVHLNEDLDDAGTSGRTLKGTDLGKVLEKLLVQGEIAQEAGDTPAFENLWAAVAWACVAVESQGCRRVLLFSLGGKERRTLKSLVSGPSLGLDDGWCSAVAAMGNAPLRRARVLRSLRRDPARDVQDAAYEGPPPSNYGYTYDVAAVDPYPKRPEGPETDEDRFARWRGEAAELVVEGSLASTSHWRRLGAPRVVRAGVEVARKACLRGAVTDRHKGQTLKVSLPPSEWPALHAAALVLFLGTLPHWDILFGQTAYVCADGSKRWVDGIVRMRTDPDVILVWDYTLRGDPDPGVPVDYEWKRKKCLERQEELQQLRALHPPLIDQLPAPLASAFRGFLVSHIVGNKVHHDMLPFRF